MSKQYIPRSLAMWSGSLLGVLVASCGSGNASTASKHCGDGYCDPVQESPLGCPIDCGCGAGEDCGFPCGDGVCQAPLETAIGCPEDCLDQCGNGTCDREESYASCPTDCAPCDGLGREGCCDGSTRVYCLGGAVRYEDCGAEDCGWSGTEYRCGFATEAPGARPSRSCGCDTDKRRPKIFGGLPDPSLCLTSGQRRAVGGLLYAGLELPFCTGTIVGDNVVVTAAHCVKEIGGRSMWPEEVDFGVGADLAAPDYIFPVRQVIPHPGYVGERPQDVAVLVLGERVSDVAVDVEPLPVLTAEPSSGFEGATAEVVGVGVTELSEYNTQQYWTTEVLKTVTSDLLLVDGEGRTGLCFGDSGGPILLPLDGGPPTVLGVLSAGDESCAGEDEFAPLVLAREILEPLLESPEFCSSLGDAGRCQGDIAQWCEGGRPQQECCSFGCEEDQQGRYRCRSEDDLCAELGSGAACMAGQLVSCTGGTATRLVCAACGAGVCEEHDGTASCVAP